MARNISPTLEAMTAKLTQQEIQVLERLDRDLPEDCDIFIKPQFNGLAPDFVIISPVGVMPILVYDWDLSSVFKPVNKRAAVSHSKDGVEILYASPVERLRFIREQILDLFCARSEMPLKQLEAIVCAGVIFPGVTTETALDFLRNVNQIVEPRASTIWNGLHSSIRILGGDALTNNAVEFLIPLAQSWRSKYQSKWVYEDVKSWLLEPEQRALNREPLELDADQQRLIKTSSSPKFRRIRGPAGSGKSLVLAARAQELCDRGASVLVVNYNITLMRWLRGYADRWAIHSRAGRTDIVPEYHNFHELLKVMCHLWSPCASQYKEIWKESDYDVDVATEKLVRLARSIIKNYPGVAGRFDAVLVDEGQDFMPAWWDILKSLCREDGERLLVADSTQDIYRRSAAWTDEVMTGAGFSGPWVELGYSYRLPGKVADFALGFASKFLPERDVIKPQKSPQQQIDYGDCFLEWRNSINASHDNLLNLVAEQTKTLVKNLADGGSWPDITVIVHSRDFGYDLTQTLRKFNIQTTHTFGGPDSRRASIEQKKLEQRKKQAFTLVSDRVKVTTINSAKGLEARGIIVVLGLSRSTEVASLAYTAITRVKASSRGSALVVLNAIERFESAAQLVGD